MIPKTIQEIYRAVLIRGNAIKVSADGSRIYEYRGPLSFIRSFKVLRPKPIREYVIRPIGKPMGKLQPDEDKARVQAYLRDKPKCRFMGCGEYIEYGYRCCPKHQSPCCRCGIRESTMHIDGKNLCGHWECYH